MWSSLAAARKCRTMAGSRSSGLWRSNPVWASGLEMSLLIEFGSVLQLEGYKRYPVQVLYLYIYLVVTACLAASRSLAAC